MKHVKSYRIWESEEHSADYMLSKVKKLIQYGLIDLGDYFKTASGLGISPPGWRKMEVSFEFDWTWADQHDTDYVTELMHEFFAGSGKELPKGCWVEPESIHVDETGWGLKEDDDEDEDDDYSYPAYHESASGSMTMWVPEKITQSEINDWAQESIGRMFSDFWVEPA